MKSYKKSIIEYHSNMINVDIILLGITIIGSVLLMSNEDWVLQLIGVIPFLCSGLLIFSIFDHWIKIIKLKASQEEHNANNSS